METSRRARTRARQAITPMQLPIATNASRILIESFFSPQAGASLLSRTERVKSLSCRTCRPALAEQFDELGGRDRHLRDAHIEGRKRILHGRYNGRSGGNNADFADAFDAERIVRRRRFLVERLQAGHFSRG